MFADQLYAAVKLAIDLEVIAFKNEEHKKRFQAASSTLAIIAHDKGIESEDFKNARENARQALSVFVRFDN